MRCFFHHWGKWSECETRKTFSETEREWILRHGQKIVEGYVVGGRTVLIQVRSCSRCNITQTRRQVA
jgi:hypothetical protein